MGYILVWEDYDYSHKEHFSDLEEVAAKLIELCKLEHENHYGTKVVELIEGKPLEYEYKRNDEKNIEEIFIEDSLWLERKIEKTKPDEVSCPVCGSVGGIETEDVSVKAEGEYYGMDLFICSECGREFCT